MSSSSEITSQLSLRELLSEPERLNEQKKQISNSIIKQSFENYNSFLNISTTNSIIYKKTNYIFNQLNVLQKKLKEFKQTTDDFYQNANIISKERSNSRISLLHYDKILSLVEIPHLTDVCIRNGLYSEALDLDDYTRQIFRANPDIPILLPLKNETEKNIYNLINRLILLLRSEIEDYSTCLKVITHLRRIGILNENELRKLFLQQRIYYFNSILKNLKKTNTYQYLIEYTENLKNELFKIVMQYYSVFPQDVHKIDDLSSCIFHIIQEYLNILNIYLNKINSGEEMRKLMKQCLFCAQTLSKIGSDITGLIIPIFYKQIERLFTEKLNNGIDKFKKSLKNYKKSNIDEIIITDEKQQLLKCIPVAELTNDILISLNELAQCAPLGIKESITKIMINSLNNVIEIFKQQNGTRFIEQKVIFILYTTN